MQAIIDFIKNNYEWFFSGVGVLFLTLIGNWIFKKRTGNKNIQIIDNESMGIQAVGSVYVNSVLSRQPLPNRTESQDEQSINHHSSGIQAGGDININSEYQKAQ